MLGCFGPLGKGKRPENFGVGLWVEGCNLGVGFLKVLSLKFPCRLLACIYNRNKAHPLPKKPSSCFFSYEGPHTFREDACFVDDAFRIRWLQPFAMSMTEVWLFLTSYRGLVATESHAISSQARWASMACLGVCKVGGVAGGGGGEGGRAAALSASTQRP